MLVDPEEVAHHVDNGVQIQPFKSFLYHDIVFVDNC
jgi:hypothetical protein